MIFPNGERPHQKLGFKTPDEIECEIRFEFP